MPKVLKFICDLHLKRVRTMYTSMILVIISFVVLLMLFGALKSDEQPTVIRDVVVEPTVNNIGVKELSIPRVTSTRQLFDADRIEIQIGSPIRTTVGRASVTAQLILSDNAPTVLLGTEDPNLVMSHGRYSDFLLIESAAGVFTVQRVGEGVLNVSTVDSTRWRNFLYKDNLWFVILSTGGTTLRSAQCKIIGKLDKASQADFDALLLSKL